jgi:hypothetical protein
MRASSPLSALVLPLTRPQPPAPRAWATAVCRSLPSDPRICFSGDPARPVLLDAGLRCTDHGCRVPTPLRHSACRLDLRPPELVPPGPAPRRMVSNNACPAQTSITSTVPITSASTSLKYSDKGRRRSLVTGNLFIVLQRAFWTFVQSPTDRCLEGLFGMAGRVTGDVARLSKTPETCRAGATTRQATGSAPERPPRPWRWRRPRPPRVDRRAVAGRRA